MSLRQGLMPYVAQAISSQKLQRAKRQLREWQRIRSQRKHQLDVFLKLDDPYSYCLLQSLPELNRRFELDIQIHHVDILDDDMFPERKLWDHNALQDARWLAQLYGLKFPQISDNNHPETRPSAPDLINQKKRRNYYLDLALNCEQSDNAIVELQGIYHAFWNNEAGESGEQSEPSNTQKLRSNEQLLKTMGHYLSAMVHYEGEWYWGLDRLDHLEQRLNDLGANRQTAATIQYDKTWRSFCSDTTKLNGNTPSHPVEMFFSARSPYSALGIQRLEKLARNYPIDIQIKPVLPMVMRNLPVPDTKKWYIFHDTKREAEKLGLRYGKVADPLGAGVERCYGIFQFACECGQEFEFLLQYAKLVNGEGVRSETDSGMKKIVLAAGLDWAQAQHYLQSQNWREPVEQNRQELLALGQWGVPCFKYGELVVWGQDRLLRIEQAIQHDMQTIEPFANSSINNG